MIDTIFVHKKYFSLIAHGKYNIIKYNINYYLYLHDMYIHLYRNYNNIFIVSTNRNAFHNVWVIYWLLQSETITGGRVFNRVGGNTRTYRCVFNQALPQPVQCWSPRPSVNILFYTKRNAWAYTRYPCVRINICVFRNFFVCIAVRIVRRTILGTF